MENLLMSLIGVVLGGIITVIVAQIYYKKSSKDLYKEIQLLNEQTIVLGKYISIVQKDEIHHLRVNENNKLGIDAIIEVPPAKAELRAEPAKVHVQSKTSNRRKKKTDNQKAE